jgi:glucose/arabinose dehydrogenase
MRWSLSRSPRPAQTTSPRPSYRPALEGLEDRLAPANLPAGFSQTLLAANLANPTAMELAPDGRIFITEQNGTLRVVKNGTLLATPFVSLNVNVSGERGLLGIAFDPNFNVNHFVYLYYTTATSPIHNRVSRFTANGDVAVPGSEVPILDLDNLSSVTIHNGGAIHFGADLKLYVAVGENGNGANAQSLSTRLGKMLRINADGTIPTDNPFYNTATGLNRAIWALGLRNPFTFAVQPGSGRIFINDVGQNTWEEIDDGIAGSNYGWPVTEGIANNPSFRDPLFEYGHGSGDTLGHAIVGGAFYDPQVVQFPSAYVGKYFFSDLVNGWIRVFDPATGTAAGFATGLPSLTVDLKADAAGNLYYLCRGDGGATGVLYRVSFTAGIQQEVFALGTDSQVRAMKVDGAGNPASDYFLAAAGAVKDFATGRDAAGRNLLFALGLDDQVYEAKFDAAGNPTGGYALAAPGRVKSLSVGQDANGLPLVFVVGLDNQVWDLKFDAAGTPAGGYALSAPGQVKSLKVALLAGGPLTLVVGLDNQVYEQKFDAAGTPASGYVLTSPGQVKSLAVDPGSSGRAEILVIGLDNQLWAQRLDAVGNAVGSYFLTAGGAVKSLDVLKYGGGQSLAFVTGLDDQVYAVRLDLNGTPTGAFVLTASGKVRSFTAGHDGSDDPELFVIGLDGQLYELQFNGAGEPQGGYALTRPGQVTLARATR